MLTAAEEEGLAGLALASRVQHALYRLPPPQLAALIDQHRAGALDRHVVYLHEGTVEPIRVLPVPITVLPEQLAYIHRVTLAVQRALERLPTLYLHDFTVREILRLPDAEEQWLRECWGPSQEVHNPVFGRLDALVDFTSPMWKESLRFVEPNLSGIGGVHMVPACERLLADIVVPALRDGDADLDLEVGHDMRELLVRILRAHAQAIGAGLQVCFIEPKYAGNGPDEQAELARWLRERHGFTVMHADPSELTLSDGQVWYEGQRVDLAYRDYGVVDRHFDSVGDALLLPTAAAEVVTVVLAMAEADGDALTVEVAVDVGVPLAATLADSLTLAATLADADTVLLDVW